MLVKCWDINEKRDREKCYKAPNNKYYSSKEAYEKIVENHKWQDKCIDLYREWTGRLDKGPSIWTKKMSQYKEYGNEVIYAAMLMADNSARYSVKNKIFANEYQMASYLWAIVNGNLIEANKKINVKKQREQDARIQEQSHEYVEIKETVKHNSSTIDLTKFL